jgi:hypothetical protein
MNTLKQLLSQEITTKPDTLQFAKDRKFEEAWIIQSNDMMPDEKVVAEYLLREKFEVLIVEYIWNSKDDDRRFVLTIFLDKKCKLQDPKEFINICLNVFYQYKNFSAFIDTVNHMVIGQDYLLNYPVESVNLSVFNHWMSVGPVDLWNSNMDIDVNLINQKIKLRPDIEKTVLNYQGLFFRFNLSGKLNGPYFGIKTPCCDKIGNEWVIDYEKVEYWMRLMLTSQN